MAEESLKRREYRIMDEFYWLLQQAFIEGNTQRFSVRLNPEHPVYRGHFPDKPIAPGVFLTQMTIDICSHYIGRALFMSEARDIKFLNIVNPGQIDLLNLDIQFDIREHEVIINALAHWDGISYFKIKAILRYDEPA